MAEKFYGKYSKRQVELANQVDLEELLSNHGERLIPSGREKRMESNHSITISGNRWYDHATEKGGFAVSFIRQFYSLSFNDAMHMLIGESGDVSFHSIQSAEKKVDIPFRLPDRNATMRRVYGYLLGERKIDKDVLDTFVKKKLIYEDIPYHNAVFVGYDEHGIPCHAQKRSTNSTLKPFRINVAGSNPAYSFHLSGRNDKLFVFEAPIDLLSYISLHKDDWEQNSYVALCGVTEHAMLKALESSGQIKNVYLCLDNDPAGNAAAERLTNHLKEIGGYMVHRIASTYKDWNDDLKAAKEENLKKGEMSLAL